MLQQGLEIASRIGSPVALVAFVFFAILFFVSRHFSTATSPENQAGRDRFFVIVLTVVAVLFLACVAMLLGEQLLQAGKASAVTYFALGMGMAMLFLTHYAQKWSRLDREERLLKSVSKEKLGTLLDTELTRYRVTGEGLPPTKRYELIATDLRQKHRYALHRLYFAAFVVVVIAILIGLLYGPSAFSGAAAVTAPAEPPANFELTVARTADDPNLPDSLFGKSDDDAMPRQELRAFDRNGIAEFGDTAVNLWLLTPAFSSPYRSFDCYVYAGTADKVIINAWLVNPTGAKQNLRRIDYVKDRGVYVFSVPKSSAGSRLLIYLGMSDSSHKGIKADPKFHVRSKLLQKEN